jgi:hypothetical protein
MNNGAVDLSDLDRRVKALIKSEDAEGITLIDEEIRAYLGFDTDGVVAPLNADQLQKLALIYEELTAHVSKVRDRLGGELRGMKTKQKGIKAYQSSK